MSDLKKDLSEMLRETLRPYIERLRDPEVVAATDARAAAAVVKMLLEKSPEEPAEEKSQATDRREILEALERLVSPREAESPGPKAI